MSVEEVYSLGYSLLYSIKYNIDIVIKYSNIIIEWIVKYEKNNIVNEYIYNISNSYEIIRKSKIVAEKYFLN